MTFKLETTNLATLSRIVTYAHEHDLDLEVPPVNVALKGLTLGRDGVHHPVCDHADGRTAGRVTAAAIVADAAPCSKCQMWEIPLPGVSEEQNQAKLMMYTLTSLDRHARDLRQFGDLRAVTGTSVIRRGVPAAVFPESWQDHARQWSDDVKQRRAKATQTHSADPQRRLIPIASTLPECREAVNIYCNDVETLDRLGSKVLNGASLGYGPERIADEVGAEPGDVYVQKVWNLLWRYAARLDDGPDTAVMVRWNLYGCPDGSLEKVLAVAWPTLLSPADDAAVLVMPARAAAAISSNVATATTIPVAVDELTREDDRTQAAFSLWNDGGIYQDFAVAWDAAVLLSP